MGNHADDDGTDVTIYRKPLGDAVHADTPTGAPEPLLALLDTLGFERRRLATPGPIYVWHEAPEQLDDNAKKQLATHAVPWLHKAGYMVHISDDVWDAAAYTAAATAVRDRRAPAPPERDSRSVRLGSMTLADERDVDVTAYRSDGTIYVDTRAAAPEHLLALLDGLGLDRHQVKDDVWHQVPDETDEIAVKSVADRALLLLAGAGYRVDIDAGLFSDTIFRDALAEQATRRPPPPPAAHARRRR
ncbi:hypothetical protein ACN2WE_30795 [Streptomyces sp. cg28]|uniref:hypothetical protein n=1 Tax=Streptomyces sp. cg28 TaxID=3403457 RepID=UPI003B227706